MKRFHALDSSTATTSKCRKCSARRISPLIGTDLHSLKAPISAHPWESVVLSLCLFVAVPNRAAETTVGLEGHVDVVLPRPDYEVKPVDDRSELILRIEAVTPAGTNGYRYDLHYIGFEPQQFDAAAYLQRADGTPATELSNLAVHVGSVLPANHDGTLADPVASVFPWTGGYRALLWSFGALWLVGLGWFAWKSRRVKPVPPPTPVRPPTLAELMRPLVEAAAAGQLSPAGQAQLERMLMGFWREKLGLEADLPMVAALARLKQHAEAGPLVLALERWLHSRQGATQADIAKLLEPYGRGGGGTA